MNQKGGGGYNNFSENSVQLFSSYDDMLVYGVVATIEDDMMYGTNVNDLLWCTQD